MTEFDGDQGTNILRSPPHARRDALGRASLARARETQGDLQPVDAGKGYPWDLLHVPPR